MRYRSFALGVCGVLVSILGISRASVGQEPPAAELQAAQPSATANDWLAQRAEWHALMSEWLAERAKPNADSARLAELQAKLQSLRAASGSVPTWQPGVCPWGGPGLGIGPGCSRRGGYGPSYSRGQGRGMGYGPGNGIGYGPAGRGFGPRATSGPRMGRPW